MSGIMSFEQMNAIFGWENVEVSFMLLAPQMRNIMTTVFIHAFPEGFSNDLG